ncbi:hypothetical protein JYU29_04655 [Tianweitania sp. BSSL-BM11]|uniref:DUF1127 domain-containing protein n=1 Tax=Tianweitania aestuarii TaxID=2814886 RepID=A0ABS5RSN4_9HYPH|nr:hypothetical protein [Tianweitania aestuarii]MBS9719977.1 hypothetical protein [Tianweitania aestuarii]
MESGHAIPERTRIYRLSRLFSALMAVMKRPQSHARPIRLYRDELTPHLARDLGLSDVMNKPSLSPGIVEQAPRF